MNSVQPLLGPFRVAPGKLSVSRSFGDVAAKLSAFGDNDKVIIARPEIRQLKLEKETDYLLIGCDGIFDKM